MGAKQPAAITPAAVQKPRETHRMSEIYYSGNINDTSPGASKSSNLFMKSLSKKGTQSQLLHQHTSKEGKSVRKSIGSIH